MEQEELNKILDDHKLWVESKGEKGKKAYLKGANLSDANLFGVNLSYVNLEGAVLYYAFLKDAYLSGANLKGANLQGANLEGAKFTIEIRDVVDLSFCSITKDQLPWLALHPDFSEFYSTLYVS